MIDNSRKLFPGSELVEKAKFNMHDGQDTVDVPSSLLMDSSQGCLLVFTSISLFLYIFFVNINLLNRIIA